MTIDQNSLTVILTIFIGGFTVAGWLEFRFRSLEKLIYREMHHHTEDDDKRFEDHALRIQRLEIKNFGVTHTP